MSSWGYGTDDGPHTWAAQFPLAMGKRQSPIDIRVKEVKYDSGLTKKPLTISYDTEKELSLGNCGYSLKAGAKGESYISGGPLSHKYKLEQFHWHWGSQNDKGSEHTIDGNTYAAELHMVHWNTELYESFGDAATSEHGLAVLGALIKVGKEDQGFRDLRETLKKVHFKGENAKITDFTPKTLLPEKTSHYWTYPGSLTTPPCAESVTWIVFQEIIEMSADQLDALRSLVCEDSSNTKSHKMMDNNRPTLPLNGREVRSSFK